MRRMGTRESSIPLIAVAAQTCCVRCRRQRRTRLRALACRSTISRRPIPEEGSHLCPWIRDSRQRIPVRDQDPAVVRKPGGYRPLALAAEIRLADCLNRTASSVLNILHRDQKCYKLVDPPRFAPVRDDLGTLM